MESEHTKGSNIEQVKKSPNASQEDGKSVLENTPAPSSSPSSSSSSHSFLKIEIGDRSPLSDGNVSSGPESLISSPDVPSQTPPWSMMSASPRGTQHSSTDLASTYSEWSTVGSSTSTPPTMKSPSAQVMGRASGYDPNRIPASIFSSKPTNATEWSVASNESLFSIHMGNSSFSRDNGVMFSKSGDAPWLEEWNNSQAYFSYVPPDSKPNELGSFPSSLPPVMEVPSHEESSVTSRKSSVVETDALGRMSNASPRKSMEEHSKENNASAGALHASVVSNNLPNIKTAPPHETSVYSSNTPPRTSSSNPRLSNESGNSSSSFAFPVLLSEGGKPGSMKVAAEKPHPQLQQQVSKAATPKASHTTTPPQSSSSWFSCLSCWPRCC